MVFSSAPKLALLITAPLLSLSAAAPTRNIPVVNPLFSSVPVQCSVGYAYQSDGGDCTSYNPQQAYNSTAGIGWTFAPFLVTRSGDGMVGRGGENFEPPSFTGLPFSFAAFLQGPNTEVSQPIYGLVEGAKYSLSFYLGSRYANGVYEGEPYDGNQTVAALIDEQTVGYWNLASFTPFTLETRLFAVFSKGPHMLRFVGLASGDHTAFLSGVSIKVAE